MRAILGSSGPSRLEHHCVPGRMQRNLVLLSAGLLPLLSLGRLAAAPQSSMSLSPASMPKVATIDDRFESYNVEMAEVIGGRFWKPIMPPR